MYFTEASANLRTWWLDMSMRKFMSPKKKQNSLSGYRPPSPPNTNVLLSTVLIGEKAAVV